jgi:hypothetical protein
MVKKSATAELTGALFTLLSLLPAAFLAAGRFAHGLMKAPVEF